MAGAVRASSRRSCSEGAYNSSSMDFMAFLHASRRSFSMEGIRGFEQSLRPLSRLKLTGRQSLALSQPRLRLRHSSLMSSAVRLKLSI